MREWQTFFDASISLHHKLLLVAERCRRLGIVRPSEKSVAAIVAILYGDAAGVSQAGPAALTAVREFKVILHRAQGTTPECGMEVLHQQLNRASVCLYDKSIAIVSVHRYNYTCLQQLLPCML